jgi:hypothetical protein
VTFMPRLPAASCDIHDEGSFGIGPGHLAVWLQYTGICSPESSSGASEAVEPPTRSVTGLGRDGRLGQPPYRHSQGVDCSRSRRESGRSRRARRTSVRPPPADRSPSVPERAPAGRRSVTARTSPVSTVGRAATYWPTSATPSASAPRSTVCHCPNPGSPTCSANSSQRPSMLRSPWLIR